MPTRTLRATPIRIDLDDLPAPFATESARRAPEWIEPPEGASLEVPAGFVVQRFARNIPMARWLAVTPDGRVLVAQSREDHITVLEDADGDGVAERRGTFANLDNGLNIPFGMAFASGGFFLGNQDEVRRYPFQRGQPRLVGRGERVTTLPGGGYHQHWTRNVILDADGQHLFVSVGSRTNVEPEAPPRAAILRMRLDGSEREVFATGLRNPVGLAVHPETGVLHASVNERDLLGDGLVPDYFTRVQRGEFYGWPYAYLHPSNLDPRRSEDGRSERPELARRTRTPDVLFEAHSAALGTTFLRQDAFPEPYRSGAFVAMRGSWNRSRGTGYQIVFIPFEDGRPLGHYRPFVTGFLVDPQGPTTWGRPVGVVETPDGALLFTDEPGGVLYRVSWGGERG
ncbi:MAG: sorbosone dehydrogenase family protein [Sandaracinaceae bacterium]